MRKWLDPALTLDAALFFSFVLHGDCPRHAASESSLAHQLTDFCQQSLGCERTGEQPEACA